MPPWPFPSVPKPLTRMGRAALPREITSPMPVLYSALQPIILMLSPLIVQPLAKLPPAAKLPVDSQATK